MKIYVYNCIHKVLKFYSFEVTKFKNSVQEFKYKNSESLEFRGSKSFMI